MSPEIIILLIGLVALMALGIPICFALMSVASAILLIFFGPAQMNVLNAAFVNQMQSESLLAIPMFVLMAAFLQTSGIGSDIYEFFHKWLGGVKGGLAMATVATTAVIAAMSGVAATATIAMGLIALPEMINRGYDKSLACGPVLAGGCLGPIIPPSTIMIIMARPKTSIRALAKSRNISGRATMRNVPSKTPIWLPPERMTTAKTTTDSQKVNELGEMMVILAAKRFPAMPAQNAPMTKAMSFRCATSMPQPSAAVSSSLMQFNARPKRDSESQWNSSTVSPTMIQMR